MPSSAVVPDAVALAPVSSNIVTVAPAMGVLVEESRTVTLMVTVLADFLTALTPRDIRPRTCGNCWASCSQLDQGPPGADCQICWRTPALSNANTSSAPSMVPVRPRNATGTAARLSGLGFPRAFHPDQLWLPPDCEICSMFQRAPSSPTKVEPCGRPNVSWRALQ